MYNQCHHSVVMLSEVVSLLDSEVCNDVEVRVLDGLGAHQTLI